MDNIEREFSYKVSCVETSCDWTINLCQVLDVRTYVTQYLDIRSLVFAETLNLDRAKEMLKNVPSGFLKKILNLP